MRRDDLAQDLQLLLKAERVNHAVLIQAHQSVAETRLQRRDA